jgi:glutamyl-Q tRNA(Asp) synthetase
MSMNDEYPVSVSIFGKFETDQPLVQPVLRFAPSPNGPLHRGHALSALLNDGLAKRLGGTLLLRIEDIDPVRSRPIFCEAIEETMHWLGIAYPSPVRRQSGHMSDYARAFDWLESRGLVYPCFCTRADVEAALTSRTDSWPRDPDGAPLYPRTCFHKSKTEIARHFERGEKPQWRLDMAEAAGTSGPLSWKRFDPLDFSVVEVKADPAQWGDVVLKRKDTPTSYHLSVVVDDALQSITHVIRGLDLEAATDIHTLLQHLFDVPQPLYWHHSLVTEGDGRKLAKSRSSLSLADERKNGLTLSQLLRDFARAGLLVNP